MKILIHLIIMCLTFLLHFFFFSDGLLNLENMPEEFLQEVQECMDNNNLQKTTEVEEPATVTETASPSPEVASESPQDDNAGDTQTQEGKKGFVEFTPIESRVQIPTQLSSKLAEKLNISIEAYAEPWLRCEQAPQPLTKKEEAFLYEHGFVTKVMISDFDRNFVEILIYIIYCGLRYYFSKKDNVQQVEDIDDAFKVVWFGIRLSAAIAYVVRYATNTADENDVIKQEIRRILFKKARYDYYFYYTKKNK